MGGIKLKIGFIGYGSMGSMIINGLLKSNAIRMEDVIISSRTKSKLNELTVKYPLIEIAENSRSLAESTDTIFLFVNTGEVKNVMEEIKEKISPDTHIIHISAGLSLELLETLFSGKISRVIPSLTSEIGKGVSLVCHNQKVSSTEKKFVEDLLANISSVQVIPEEDFEVGSDLTSCAPAFMACIMKIFAENGAKRSGIHQEEAEDMVINTLYGTALLLKEKEMSFEEVISRVATKGGITAEGIKVLENKLPAVFEELFETTLRKNKAVRENLKEQYS